VYKIVSNAYEDITSAYCTVPDLYLVESIECCKFNNKYNFRGKNILITPIILFYYYQSLARCIVSSQLLNFFFFKLPIS